MIQTLPSQRTRPTRVPRSFFKSLEASIRNQFYISPYRPLQFVCCQCEGGIVLLTGVLPSFFELIGNGQCTRDIADALYLSVKTIERHKESVKQKLSISHSTQLVQHATQWVLQRGY